MVLNSLGLDTKNTKDLAGDLNDLLANFQEIPHSFVTTIVTKYILFLGNIQNNTFQTFFVLT